VQKFRRPSPVVLFLNVNAHSTTMSEINIYLAPILHKNSVLHTMALIERLFRLVRQEMVHKL